ncbi:MAG: hypothetical protein MMC33_004821 [Icmadophila ericetorum]|nr:hypothetical protein [Icmadophila ericetorum]
MSFTFYTPKSSYSCIASPKIHLDSRSSKISTLSRPRALSYMLEDYLFRPPILSERAANGMLAWSVIDAKFITATAQEIDTGLGKSTPVVTKDPTKESVVELDFKNMFANGRPGST